MHKQLLIIITILHLCTFMLRHDFQLTSIRISKMCISLTSLQDRRQLQFGQAIS